MAQWNARYLDPKIDLAFKRVFGQHAHLLKSFLNAMLPLEADGQIESLEYLTSEQVPEIPGLLKNSIVDVKCVDAQGRIFIVEMQMLWTPSFTNRIVFGASQAYVQQLKAGHDYRELRPVYALALINDIFDRQTDAFYHHYKIVNLENTTETLKGLEFVFVELPKFKATSLVSKKMQVLWLRFLNEIGEETKTIDAQMNAERDIAEAIGLVETAAYSEQELSAYHLGLDKRRIETSLMGDLRAEGVEKGMASMVQALFKNGMPAAEIARSTGLTSLRVNELLKLK
jgi:predicted transposase/invertase (TIGR01784 family)